MYSKTNPQERIYYEQENEKREALQLISRKNGDLIKENDISDVSDEFIKETSISINRETLVLKKHIANLPLKAVMVGFGYFPSTLLNFRLKFPLLKLTGLDSNKEVCSFAVDFVSQYRNTSDIEIINVNAEDFNFLNFDIIFLANALVNKDKILNAIYHTAKKDSLICCRKPLPSRIEMFESVSTENKFIEIEQITNKLDSLSIFKKN